MSPIADLITRRSQSSLMMGAGAVFAGSAAAILRGNFEILPASLCLLFVIFMQLGGNYYYTYFDESRNCGSAIDKRIASQKSQISLPMLKEFSFGLLLLSAMVGLALLTMCGLWTLPIGIAIMALSWFSCGGNEPLLRTPFGIFATFILFGPLCVIPTSLVQSFREAIVIYNWFDIAPAIFMSIVIGLMASNANILYGYSTYLTDLRNSKRTFVTQWGRKATRVVFFINGLLYTAVSYFMCINLHLDLYGLDMLPSTLCFIIDLYIWWKMRTLPRYKLKSLVPIGTLNVLLMGLLSLIIFSITGVPDDSRFTFF